MHWKSLRRSAKRSCPPWNLLQGLKFFKRYGVQECLWSRWSLLASWRCKCISCISLIVDEFQSENKWSKDKNEVRWSERVPRCSKMFRDVPRCSETQYWLPDLCHSLEHPIIQWHPMAMASNSSNRVASVARWTSHFKTPLPWWTRSCWRHTPRCVHSCAILVSQSNVGPKQSPEPKSVGLWLTVSLDSSAPAMTSGHQKDFKVFPGCSKDFYICGILEDQRACLQLEL